MISTKSFLIVVLTVLSVGVFTSNASAAVIGTLDVANCAGGGVAVTLTTIDWLPTGGGTGCIITGSTTNVTYTGGGPLGPSTTGVIKDLVAGSPFPVTDFMTFTGNPSLHFDLTSLGPGVVNTTCATVLNPNLPSCSVFAGSPFILAPTASGTSVTLSAFGTARDASALLSNWLGAYTTQIAGITPAAIQAIILAGGTMTNTHSGNFTITAIPEPASLTLLGTGLLGVAMRARKRLRRS